MRVILPVIFSIFIMMVLVAAFGAKDSATHPSGDSARQPADQAPTAAAEPSGEELQSTIRSLLQETVTQESGKDATCWTTVRIMDAHFAGKPLIDEVASLKIESCKTLVYQLWRHASLLCPSGHHQLQSDDVAAALPPELKAQVEKLEAAKGVLTSDSIKAVMDRDYNRITENKRYLISIAEEAVLHEGLFNGRRVDILPLSEGAADRMASFATLITTSFLQECGRLAQSRGHSQLSGDDMKDAFATCAAVWTDVPSRNVSATPGASALQPDPGLLDITRTVISNKITALRAWNAPIWKGIDPTDATDHQRELMNRFCKIKFDGPGFEEMMHLLELYADYIAWGVEPMRHNVFSAPINQHDESMLDGSVFARERKPYIELVWGLNVINDLFPRSIAKNGDVTVNLMEFPAELAVEGRKRNREVRLLDYELDAVRDTTLHWSVMQRAWANPEARPTDPFVLEVLADRLSELALLFVRVCDAEAREQSAAVIDKELCQRVFDGCQFAVPATMVPRWTPIEAKDRSAILDRFPAEPFKDASATSGFPAATAIFRPDPKSLSNAGVNMALVDFMGAGIAVGDFERTGLPGLFLVGEGGNRLLRNLGGHKFQDVTDELGITDRRLDDAHQALFVDYDNDGRLDLFIVHSASPSRLFHQLANGHFEDVTNSCGIVTGPGAHDAVWFDFDNDGLLDCYVGHYGTTRPTLDGRNGSGNRLFHNLGNGHFEDVTRQSRTGSTGWTLATAAIDYDHDGWPDIFVANDYGRSELFHNNHDGTFKECGRSAGVDDRGSSMNASIIDLDGDGWMGLFVTQIDMFSKSIGFVFPRDDTVLNINERILRSTFSIAGNKLYRNRHDGSFESIEDQQFEPGDRGWAWSANFFDYDNAGADACYMTNGWLDGTPAARQAHQFFINDHGRFYQWDRGGDQGFASNARGCVAADLTGTGHIDLVVNNYGDPPRLLVNTCANGNHWVKVRLRGVRCNRFGVGAEVGVVRIDGLRQWRQVSCGSNYLSQEETTLTFGLGAADHLAEVDVRWPGNRLQKLAGPLKADSLIEVVEEVHDQRSGAGQPAP